MGHRLELYIPEKAALRAIEIATSFGIEAQIIGHVEPYHQKQVTIESEHGKFIYKFVCYSHIHTFLHFLAVGNCLYEENFTCFYHCVPTESGSSARRRFQKNRL